MHFALHTSETEKMYTIHHMCGRIFHKCDAFLAAVRTIASRREVKMCIEMVCDEGVIDFPLARMLIMFVLPSMLAAESNEKGEQRREKKHQQLNDYVTKWKKEKFKCGERVRHTSESRTLQHTMRFHRIMQLVLWVRICARPLFVSQTSTPTNTATLNGCG